MDAIGDGSNLGWRGGILQPSINSMITKRVGQGDLGGTLGISPALLGSANAAAPIFSGAPFGAFSAGMPFLVFGLIMTGLLFSSFRMIKPIDPAGQSVQEA